MRFITLQRKDVINASTGAKIGYVSDLEIDCLLNCIEAIVVEKFSPFKFLCLFKGPPSIVIPVCNVISIGEDVIIVNIDCL